MHNEKHFRSHAKISWNQDEIAPGWSDSAIRRSFPRQMAQRRWTGTLYSVPLRLPAIENYMQRVHVDA